MALVNSFFGKSSKLAKYKFKNDKVKKIENKSEKTDLILNEKSQIGKKIPIGEQIHKNISRKRVHKSKFRQIFHELRKPIVIAPRIIKRIFTKNLK